MYKYNYNSNNNSSTQILYELALAKGKNRGWYPSDWCLNDYVNHIFKTNKSKKIEAK